MSRPVTVEMSLTIKKERARIARPKMPLNIFSLALFKRSGFEPAIIQSRAPQIVQIRTAKPPKITMTCQIMAI